MSEPLRPMELEWLENESVQQAKKAMAYDRCRLMEDALRAVGYAKHEQAWSVAVLIAKICDGWEPLVRDLAELASDRDIATKSKNTESRKKMLLRQLVDLQEHGLIKFNLAETRKRRRTRPAKSVVIFADPRTLKELIRESVEIRTSSAQTPDKCQDKQPDKLQDKSRTNSGHLHDHTTLYSHTPNPLLLPEEREQEQKVSTVEELGPCSSESAAFGELVKAFTDVGVSGAFGLLRDALPRVGIVYLQNLLDHYRGKPGAWGPGALRYRVKNSHPSIAIAADWPPPKSTEAVGHTTTMQRGDAMTRKEQLFNRHRDRVVRCLNQKFHQQRGSFATDAEVEAGVRLTSRCANTDEIEQVLNREFASCLS